MKYFFTKFCKMSRYKMTVIRNTYSVLLSKSVLLMQATKTETLSWVYRVAGEEPKKDSF